MSENPGNNSGSLVKRGRCQLKDCDCTFTLFRDSPRFRREPLHIGEICMCHHTYLRHQVKLPPEDAAPPISMRMDTEAGATPPTSLWMDTGAAAIPPVEITLD